jgi:hypothetical protein
MFIDIPEGTKKRSQVVGGLAQFEVADFDWPPVPWARCNKPFPGKWVVNLALFYPHEKVGKTGKIRIIVFCQSFNKISLLPPNLDFFDDGSSN